MLCRGDVLLGKGNPQFQDVHLTSAGVNTAPSTPYTCWLARSMSLPFFRRSSSSENEGTASANTTIWGRSMEIHICILSPVYIESCSALN